MRFDCLSDWLAWQERLHHTSVDLGLARISKVAGKLGLTRVPFPVISVAGTNGKGSCVALLTSIFEQAGYRVGAYTSPHLLRYNERVRIEGHEASDAALIQAFDEIEGKRGNITLTYFEFGTLAAMILFCRAELDLVVLEVGMGGRYDAVNIFDADVALVTAIGIDHVDWLGHDRASIGREKAGIYRTGRPAICGDPNPPASVEEYARSIGATWYCAGRDFNHHVVTHHPRSMRQHRECLGSGEASPQWRWEGRAGTIGQNLPEPALPGKHQLQNAAAVLMAVELLRNRLPVSENALHRGLTAVRLPGRFQVFSGKDGITRILDVAHNPQAAQALARMLRDCPCEGRTLAVVAMLEDKDIEAVLRAMWMPISGATSTPQNNRQQRIGFTEENNRRKLACAALVDVWYAAGLDVPRGGTAEMIVAAMSRMSTKTHVHSAATVADAYNAALQTARSGDRIVVFGSFHTVGEGLRLLHKLA
ncbi:MAG: bifunctional tetrahydrofolate synthase/dihydrofolate synthase [Gammaproteobacteria bacterium]|nr:bifunctional tetrahydrofolate synthase/dihydrofolate synthase [Gammaproteobacteria bacterium]NNJ83809.1 bifunctional tetrahydrofolate synthase/dihydrofolate synthase [Gammaproteobacteria bacterium]